MIGAMVGSVAGLGIGAAIFFANTYKETTTADVKGETEVWNI